MAISVVQTASAKVTTSGSTLTVTFGAGTTAGNTVVVAISHFESTARTVSSVLLGGAAGNFGQLANAVSVTPFQSCAIWADPNCAGGQTSITITLSGAASDISAVAWEVSGLLSTSTPSSLLDKSSTNSGSGSSWTSSATATTTQASELWVGVASASNTPTGPSSPWTNTEPAGDSTFIMAGVQVASSTGTATYSGTQVGSFAWSAAVVTLKSGASNVNVSLTTAQVNIAAPAPAVRSGPIALPVAQVNVSALPVTPGQAFALPVAQVNIAALPPGVQHGWTTSLTTAQVTVAARPPAPSVNIALALSTAHVTVAALPPEVSRQLIISLASHSGTDDYGNAFPQGILATAGTIEGPNIIGALIESASTGRRTTLDSNGDIKVFNASGAVLFWYSNSDNSLFQYTDTGSSTQGALVSSVTAAAGTDPFGNQYLAGMVSYSSGTATQISDGAISLSTGTLTGGWTTQGQVFISPSGVIELSTAAGVITSNNTLDNGSGGATFNGNVTVAGTLSVNGSGSTASHGLTDGTINGTSGGASAGTAHTHGPGSYAVANGQHSHVL
jgi:hypothetical protein